MPEYNSMVGIFFRYDNDKDFNTVFCVLLLAYTMTHYQITKPKSLNKFINSM